MKSTLDRLKDTLRDAMPGVDLEAVTPETNLTEDLYIDSMDQIMIALLIEEEFNISLADVELPQTAGDLCALIEAAVPAEPVH